MKLFLAQFNYKPNQYGMYVMENILRIVQAEDVDAAEEKIYIHMDVSRHKWVDGKSKFSGGCGDGIISDLEINECL